MGSRPVGISASRGAAVLGLSPFSTPVAVWTQIMEDRQPGFCLAHGIEPPPPVANAAIRWGTAFENAVIQLAEIARGMTIGSREALCQLRLGPGTDSSRPPLAGIVAVADNIARLETATLLSTSITAPPYPDVPITCHLDGIYSDGVIHEGKTTSAFAFRDAWGEPGTDRIPRQYSVQVAHQMLCSGATSAIVSVLVFPNRADDFEAAGLRVDARTGVISGGHTCDPDCLICECGDAVRLVDSATGWARVLRDMGFFHTYVVAADPELQAMMLSAYRDFWTRYVLTETPPPPETYEDIKRLIPEPRGTVVADEMQERWASEYRQIGDESAAAKKRQDQLKALLLGGIERGAEHPIDSDSVESIVLRDRTGKKIASYAKEKSGKKVFRCGG